MMTPTTLRKVGRTHGNALLTVRFTTSDVVADTIAGLKSLIRGGDVQIEQ